MLMKFLSDKDKVLLLKLAKLLAFSDKPLLWEAEASTSWPFSAKVKRKQDLECRKGKTFDQITATTDLDDLSIEEGKGERELLEELMMSARIDESDNQVYDRLVEVLKSYPITKLSSDETRVEAAMTVLRELLKDERFELPSSSKVILYELLLIALRDGNISSIEWALLKEYQIWSKIEDFIFQDILKRVESLNQEISQTIAIILE